MKKTALLCSESEKLTESRMECRVIFRQVLVRGLLEWMCLSSRWKKLTLSWNVSEPPMDDTVTMLLHSPLHYSSLYIGTTQVHDGEDLRFQDARWEHKRGLLSETVLD